MLDQDDSVHRALSPTASIGVVSGLEGETAGAALHDDALGSAGAGG